MMSILCKKLYFRAIEEDDIDCLYLWANDREITDMLCGWHFPGSKAFIKKWINDQTGCDKDKRFIICTLDHRPIGTISLVNIDWKNRNSYLGIMIGDKSYHGKGYGYEALKLVINFAFLELGLNRLDTDIIEYNEKSIKLFEKVGWVRDGYKKNFFYRKGKSWGRLSYGLENQAKVYD